VAATDRVNGRALRRRRRHLRRLPWLAAGLGAFAVRDAQGQSSVDTRFLFYKESGGRTQVLDPVILLNRDFGDKYGQVGLLLGYDAISGASPTGAYPTSETTTSASGHLISAGSFPQSKYTDSRKSASLSYQRKFGAQLPSVDISYAKENDYVARTVGLSDAWTIAEGRGTLHFGVSFARDLVEPVTNPTTNPAGKNLQFDKSENGYSLGLSWILGERDLIDVSASLMQLSGYLNDPYKVVPVGPATDTTDLPDHRPDTRSRRALVVKYGHHYPWEGAVKIIYRYYNDDWSIQAHTVEVTYEQHLLSDWIVAPQVRLYTQTAASFYGSRFATPKTFLSSDYRLSPLDNVLGGLTITRKIDASLSANIGATLQSQRGRDRVTPTPPLHPIAGAPVAGPTSAADMTVLTFTFGLTKLF
jgi:Protein of unknown function (DUF3570)